MSERYRLHIYCHRIKIFGICLNIDVLWLLSQARRPLSIVLCEESPYDLINVLRPFSVILQPWNFNNVKFTYRVSKKSLGVWRAVE